MPIPPMMRIPGEPPDTLEQFRAAAIEDFEAAGYNGADGISAAIRTVVEANTTNPGTIFKLADDCGVELTKATRVYRSAYNNPMFAPIPGPYFGIDLRGIVAREMGAALASTLGRHGRFCELSYLPPVAWGLGDGEKIVVTIARSKDKTPSTLLRQCEGELQRALDALEAAGVPFEPAFKPLMATEHPDLKAAREAAGPEGLRAENCRIDVGVEPNELFCTACGARQPLPAYFTASTYTAIAEAFVADHEGERCNAAD